MKGSADYAVQARYLIQINRDIANMEKTVIYALFNNANREFTAWMTDISALPETIRNNMLLQEINLEDYGVTDAMFNPERYKWQGNYDTGKFVDLLADNKAVVTEEEVHEKYDGLFFRKYTVKDVLYTLIDNTLMHTKDGLDMQTFLRKLLTRKENDINYYKTSGVHIYETVEEQLKRQRKAFENGKT